MITSPARPPARRLFHLGAVAIFAVLQSVAPARPATAAEPVRTTSGLVVGAEGSRGVEAFRAIPYAKAPVGDLRWRPPQPPAQWSGVRSAVSPGHACPQPGSTVASAPQSEDCLTLDVFTGARRLGQVAPVLVWIHGGGFMVGSGVTPDVDGAQFVKSGVVLVNINYRLGRLGFFAHPALSREAHGGPVANYGLMDQIAALKWVRDNIAAFGGDPRHVTIAGGSAGGASVLALMTSPEARGLFHQAIVQSGLGRERTLDLRGAERLGVALARRWGVMKSDAKALRATPVQTILAQEKDPNEPFLSGQFPILDGKILPRPVLETFEAGREAPVPLVIGAMTLELPTAIQPAVLKARIPAYALLPPGLRAVYPDPARYAGLLASDVVFAEPSAKLAALHARRAPTFVYRFGITADAVQARFGGAVHGTEGPYVFGTYDASPFPIGPRQRALGETVHDYWASFIRAGDPNGSDRPVWPRFANNLVMSFTNDGLKPGVDPAAARLAAVGAALEQGVLDVLAHP